MKNLLRKIYGDSKGDEAFQRLSRLLAAYPKNTTDTRVSFAPSEVVLITYGDSLKSRTDEAPLQTLHVFCNKYLKHLISTVHLLPFFPYSSDDGFSVKDYYAVAEQFGTWQHVKALGNDFELMFDFVLNHISAQSEWFKNYLADLDDWKKLAIEVDPAADLSQVTRPRTLPLLTTFKKASGREVQLWTTFSADQIDINYANVSILLKMLEVLLFYVKTGASILRLDAIAYLWKQIGTNCIHLPQTHDLVKLFRMILDQIAPQVKLLTETNVPHAENIRYFGNGHDEAQLVYNFSLPPLLLHTLHEEDSSLLAEWVASLHLPSSTTTFFNFTASHDGIGTRPLEGILTKKEIDRLLQLVHQNGGQVSNKQNADGSQSPYELNITYIDACRQDNNDKLLAERFLASQAIQLVLPGIPGIYLPTLLGSRNWLEGVKLTGQARTINRQKLILEDLEQELSDPASFRASVFFPYLRMIKQRVTQPAFHPHAAFEVLQLNRALFALKRASVNQTIYCLTNISGRKLELDLRKEMLPINGYDLLSGKSVAACPLQIHPYQSFWITNARSIE